MPKERKKGGFVFFTNVATDAQYLMKYDVKLSTIFVKVCYLNVFPVTKLS
jgi:hypothetical protein